jgi:hypothetical protein
MPCTAPLNIVQNLQTEKICKLKCAYQFTYPSTTLQITNFGSMLVMEADAVATPPVIYNDQNYNVEYIVLVQPSLHTYNGQKTSAELIITHVGASGNKLWVCIPIKASSTSTADSTNYFDMIMSVVSQTAPASGGRTIFNSSTFSLNKLVPMTPFFSYNGGNMFLPVCTDRNESIDYIVYHADNAIFMTPTAFGILQRVIPVAQQYAKAVEESENPGGIFYNPNGPISPNQPDIYIDCQPTGDDGEVLVAATKDTSSLLDNKLIKDLMSSKLISAGIKIFIGLILMIVIWMLMIKIVKGITSSVVKATDVVTKNK